MASCNTKQQWRGRFRPAKPPTPRVTTSNRTKAVELPCCSSLPASETHNRSMEEWEKQFGMQWTSFMEAKQYTRYCSGVMNWEDSASMEAFHTKEKKFWSKNIVAEDRHRHHKVVWNCGVDPKLIRRSDNAEEVTKSTVGDNNNVVFAGPTGCDVLCDEWNLPAVLTGMIVGDGAVTKLSDKVSEWRSVRRYRGNNRRRF